MSLTALKRAAMVLGGLVILWGGFAVFRGSLSDPPLTFELPPVPAGEVDRIEIRGPEDSLLIRLGADLRWTVNGRPGSRAAVEEVFTALADTAWRAELVARNPGSHERLGVDSLTGRRVVFRSGDRVLLDLYLGRSGRDFQSAYVRGQGDEAVYLLRGRLANLLARRMDAWRDREIVRIPADSVGGLSVRYPAGGYTLRRTEEGWRVNGAAADSAEVRRLLEELGSLRAGGFPTAAQEDSITFADADRRLAVLDRVGDTLAALVFDSTASGVWVRHDSGGVVWRLDAWRAGRIMPPESLLVVGR